MTEIKKMKNKKKLKRKRIEEETKEEEKLPPQIRHSDEPPPKKTKWINKQRVLVIAMRGITHINRHLMEDMRTLLPHSKRDNKVEKGNDNLSVISEIAVSKNCNKCILFENRRRSDLYMWFANIGDGPSIKFAVESVYTMRELKLTGNCLKGSRPLLSFDETFSKEPQYMLIKELFIQIFSTPNHHPKSQPFIDHVFNFSIIDNRIWFRNFQILSEDGALVEIGPRFVLNPIKLFAGSFGGEVLWENPNYVSAAMYRRQLSKLKSNRYENRKQQKEHRKETKPEKVYEADPLLQTLRSEEVETVEAVEKKIKKQTKEKKRLRKKKLKQMRKILS